ncbi:hypothetical protein [Hoeflea sp. TYP-13]|uniref:hypothetical protein n=1 Tax=Hoeflea sp. TYP-13 TaxID=3230023 RepID=UPI0034C5E64C
MKPRPDFSPLVLAGFLQIRLGGLHCRHGKVLETCSTCRRNYLIELRKNADITERQLDSALHGRLRQAAARERLWAALNCAPPDHGIRLLSNGQQCSVLTPCAPAALAPDGAAEKSAGPQSRPLDLHQSNAADRQPGDFSPASAQASRDSGVTAVSANSKGMKS